jgi:hypothetical protein
MCAAGQCQPVTLATNQMSPLGIVVNGSGVFWAAQNGLFEYSFSTASTSQLNTTGATSGYCSGFAGAVAIDSSNLYWASGEDVCGYALANGAVADDALYTGNLLQNVAINGTTIYSYDQYDEWIQSRGQGTYETNPPAQVTALTADSQKYLLAPSLLGHWHCHDASRGQSRSRGGNDARLWLPGVRRHRYLQSGRLLDRYQWQRVERANERKRP